MTTTTTARNPMRITYGAAPATAYWDDHGTLTVHRDTDPGSGSMLLTRIHPGVCELVSATREDSQRWADILTTAAGFLTPGGPGAVRYDAAAAAIRARLATYGRARHCHVHHLCTDHPTPADKWQLPCTCSGGGRPEESGD